MLRGAHLQSILPSTSLRRARVWRRAAELLAVSYPVELDCGDQVTLAGYHSANRSSNSLVVIVHGWEGAADSSYVLSAAAHLYAQGHSIFRLNLRDHGDTLHLNSGIFHSCRLREVVGAISAISNQFKPERLSLVGFSLGGNFMLRVAADPQAPAIERVVAVGPVLDPSRTMQALENGPGIYKRYFLKKWRRSLQAKARIWPDLYRFDQLHRYKSLAQMTEDLVLQHTEFSTLSDYLNGYAIIGNRLALLKAPSVILAALDDPIIPADDLNRLAGVESLKVMVTDVGGHCGYVESLSGPTFADRYIGELLAI